MHQAKPKTVKKWDGHTHSGMCRHGDGDRTATMVEKAIEAGFTHYSITEHAPLPDDFFPTETLLGEFGLLRRELPDYFDLIRDLKRLYGNRIRIYCGLEFDYLRGQESFTRDLIASCENELDEFLLSIHFMEGKKGFCCIDFTPEDFGAGLVRHHGGADRVHDIYWSLVEAMVSEKWHASLPVRIGHLGLIDKYVGKYPLKDRDRYGTSYFENLFRRIKGQGYGLDVNAAGLDIKTCGEIYFTVPMRHWSEKLNIELVYGSDAHGARRVGRYYDTVQSIFGL